MTCRKNCFLSQLSPEQQDTLYDWILANTYVEVQKRLASPAPEGFGIHAQITSLKRFYSQRTQELRQITLQELAETNPAGEPSSLPHAASESIDYMAYDLATSGGPTASFNDLSRWSNRNKTLSLKQAYLELAQKQLLLAKQHARLEREKFEFNAVRLALDHVGTLKEIHNNDTLDDEDKIRRAREAVFGPNLPD